jgi:hypothetical protein
MNERPELGGPDRLGNGSLWVNACEASTCSVSGVIILQHDVLMRVTGQPSRRYCHDDVVHEELEIPVTLPNATIADNVAGSAAAAFRLLS